MLNPITLPFANQLVEDRLEVRRWMETLPVSPSERVIRELQKRRVKDQIGTRTETMLAVVDEFFFVIKAKLERSAADAVEDKKPMNAAAIISELELDHVRSQ